MTSSSLKFNTNFLEWLIGFSVLTGLNADRTKAGYNPANVPVKNVNPANYIQMIGSVKENDKGLSNILLNKGNIPMAIPIAISPEISANKTDSVRNWAIRLKRWAPTTLRTATSFALF